MKIRIDLTNRNTLGSVYILLEFSKLIKTAEEGLRQGVGLNLKGSNLRTPSRSDSEVDERKVPEKTV